MKARSSTSERHSISRPCAGCLSWSRCGSNGPEVETACSDLSKHFADTCHLSGCELIFFCISVVSVDQRNVTNFHSDLRLLRNLFKCLYVLDGSNLFDSSQQTPTCTKGTRPRLLFNSTAFRLVKQSLTIGSTNVYSGGAWSPFLLVSERPPTSSNSPINYVGSVDHSSILDSLGEWSHCPY